MSKLIILFVCIVALTSSVWVQAVSEEGKSAFLEAVAPLIAECSKTHSISEDDLKAAKEAKSTANLESCFIGCIMKKADIINAQGLYDVDAGLSKLAKLVKNKEDFAKMEVIGKKCISVNDEVVSDGEAGCERAKILMDCFRKYKKEIAL